MGDARIIPLLDPEPTEEELEHGKTVANSRVWSDSDRAVIADSSARIKAAERVRVARQTIEWGIDALGLFGDASGVEHLEKLLKLQDAAIKEREGNRERD